MSFPNPVQEVNRKLAWQVNEEARENPDSPYARKFVGIANGQIVAVADDLEEMTVQLRRAEPDPERTFCID
jgi:hypothetical protein